MITADTYGQSTVVLERGAADRSKRRLSFQRDSHSKWRVLDIRVPKRDTRYPSEFSEHVALGLDGTGRMTIVIQSRTGLYCSHVSRPQQHRVPRTTRDDGYPSLFRGQLAMAHNPDEKPATVRTGTLTNGPDTTRWRAREDESSWVEQTAVGAGGAVAFVLGNDGLEEALFNAFLLRPGKAPLGLWPGDHHNGGVQMRTYPSGRRLDVTSHTSSREYRYFLPSGRRLTR
jgi:hypothetical protein